MLTPDQQKLLTALVQSATSSQKIWLAGFFSGITLSGTLEEMPPDPGTGAIDQANPLESASTQQESITILFGSHTGNSELVARQLSDTFQEKGGQVHLFDLNDYKPRNLKKEKNLVLVVSTHGEGEPPIAAEEFYEFVHSERAPNLEHLRFSVCALGDSSYQYFCKTGADLDSRLEALGGQRVVERIDCDLDFEERAEIWINRVVDHFTQAPQPMVAVPVSGVSISGTQPGPAGYSKKHPFPASVLGKTLLSGRGSKKENYHIELSIEGSGLDYLPGDALGVVPRNSPAVVNQLLNIKSFDPLTMVQNGFGSKPLEEALAAHYELSVLTRDVVQNYANLSGNTDLLKLVTDDDSLFRYLYGRDVIDLLEDYPADIAPEQLIQVLRKLPPRLYSIASSPLASPEEVHLTVGAVRYENKGRQRDGVCSGLVADRLQLNDMLPVYIDSNKNFRLPDDHSLPVIMVGPGTGIAPFRAFMQHREMQRAAGKNWLFFGDQHFTTDFLYQTEWQQLHERGILTHIDLAFSRDTNRKVYVQDRMREKSKELYSWLEEGAHFYVCGDSKRMAPDVHQALVDVVTQHNGGKRAAAEEYVHHLKKARRYVEDVY